MSIFEFAMQMELDGKAYYEELAGKVEVPQLKKVLLEMAADEDKHYMLFKAMKEDAAAVYDPEKATRIFASTKNIFEELKETEGEYQFSNDVQEAWARACDIEKKAEAFYRQKADEVDNEAHKAILLMIADEEHKHWTVIEHVINFLDHPKTWLENAEWSDLN